ncbi:hypothetical protein HPB48_010396 [Haemaphysalis longicornis]|uniref:Uncharacterized protein n=1 Tax=Haemaphysalis longicornis TaxID=44386 RepID=A0A9J6GZF7_HAELO|nr:hypothetical protein HPB48_010396 [Haemaphysalis longicornis]
MPASKKESGNPQRQERPVLHTKHHPRLFYQQRLHEMLPRSQHVQLKAKYQRWRESIFLANARLQATAKNTKRTWMRQQRSMAATPRPACTLRTIGTQAVGTPRQLTWKGKTWTDKQGAWKARNERLQATVDAYKIELARLKEDNNVAKL